jgi:DNA primase
LRAALGNLGFDATLAKLDRVGPAFGWYSHPDAALADADAVLRQALTLHRKARALHRELLSAEAALALDASDANFARMRDIQEQLSALAGTEAAVEGFGASSGRPKPAI